MRDLRPYTLPCAMVVGAHRSRAKAFRPQSVVGSRNLYEAFCYELGRGLPAAADRAEIRDIMDPLEREQPLH